MSEDRYYYAYRHQDGREMKLELTGWGTIGKTPEEIDERPDFTAIRKALRRLAKQVMK